MNTKNTKLTLAALAVALTLSAQAKAENEDSNSLTTNTSEATTAPTETETQQVPQEPELTPFQKFAKRFSIGGYGEAVMTRNFYSQHFNRYKYPENYKDDDSHGRFDLPHVVINMGYDFGRGWKMGMEIEFEHGGTESAVELDADESGEYEAETEKGGEVALEQFWIEKSFHPLLNLRAGEIVVPVGATNAHHMPTEFFTSYRPEGEATIFPCTWHQVGVSLWGRSQQWGYEAQFLSGLDSEKFGSECFIHYGATSIYEFKIANTYAAALRVDNYSVPGLRLSVSGYYGRSFDNKLRTASSKYDDVEGDVLIGAFDFKYEAFNFIARGNFDYAHLSDASEITTYNTSYPKHSSQDGSPSKRQPIAEVALTYGVEVGYDFFGLSAKQREHHRRMILFGRYEYYDSMHESDASSAYDWCEKNRMAIGVNYCPMREIVIKGEYSKRFLDSAYNDEPSISLSIAYSGWFK